MSVSLYVGSNGDTRALANIARDLSEQWPDARIDTRIGGLKGCSVVFNQMLEQVGVIEDQRRYVGYGPQVLLFAANVEEFGPLKVRQTLLWLEHVPMVVHSQYHLKRVSELLRAFSPAHLRKLESNLHYIPGGIHPDFTPAAAADPNRWVVPYNRCDQTQKRVKLHAELTTKARLLLRGTPIRQDYYLRSMEELEGQAVDTSGYELQVCPPTRAEWADNARQCGMFLSTSRFESFGLMYLELLASGCVGVFVDAPWVRLLLPGYPFVCSPKDAPAMMAAVHRDYLKARAYVLEKTIPFIQKTYSFTEFARRLRQLIDTTAKKAKA